MRAAPESTWRAATTALAGAALVGWASFAGALPGDDGVSTVGIGAVLALLAVALLAGVPRLDCFGIAAGAGLLALTAWAAGSIAWSIAGDRSWDATNLLLATFVFLGLGAVLAAAAGPRALQAAATVLTLVLFAVLGWALLGAAVPALFPGGDRIARLREPVGHAPALALLAGAAVPLAGLLVARGRAPRVAGAALGYAAVLALMLTQSRAGIVAALVVTAVWAVLAGDPVLRVAQLLPAVLPALAVAGFAFTQSPLVDDGSARADRVDVGALFAAAALAGLAVAVALELRLPVGRAVRARPQAARRAAAALAVLFAGAAVAAVAATGDPFSAGECANDPSRLLEACANNRLDWWREAWEVFSAHPATGTGAQTFEVARTRVRDAAVPVAEPHSVPLQLLSDLGLVGLALAAIAAAGVALGLRATLRRLGGAERQAAAALVCLPVAFAIHGLFDYGADFLAVTAPTLLATGALLAAGRPAQRVSATLAPVAVTGAALVVASLLLPLFSSRAVDAAYEALGERRERRAVRLADRAVTLDPLSFQARIARAVVAPDDASAERAYLELTEMQPENAEAWYQLGLFRYELKEPRDACGAYTALNRAYTLDPMSDRWAPGGVLDRARDDVNLRRACG